MPADGKWGVERLDLDAYLERIGSRGDPRPDRETLIAMHRAHVTSIPFENLDVVLGRGISLELEDVQDKLVGRRRGGYCFEQGLLFAAALERIGFSLSRLIARVSPRGPHPGPRTHMLSRVLIDGSPWLADVGFGGRDCSSRLRSRPTPRSSRTAGATASSARARAHGCSWRRWESSGQTCTRSRSSHSSPSTTWSPTTSPRRTRPRRSSGSRSCSATRSAFRRRLRGLELTIERPDGGREQRTLTAVERDAALEDSFGIVLTPSDRAALRSYVAAR